MKKYILALLLAPSMAGAFQTEVAGEFYRSDYDDAYEFSGIMFAAEYYLKPVNVGGHPLAEAAFLERSSSVELILGRTEADFSSGYGFDGPLFGAAMTFMEKGQALFFRAEYILAEYEENRPPNSEISTDVFSISPGIFVGDSALIRIIYNLVETKAFGFDSESVELGLEFKGMIGNVNLEGAISQNSSETSISKLDNNEVSINADYYLNDKASVGGKILMNSGDDTDAEGNAFMLKSRFFVNENTSFKFEYEKFYAENEIDQSSVLLGAGVRF